jgi:Glycosyl hydrolase 36 superfamily, catalytic domain/Glycosyltransferase family 36
MDRRRFLGIVGAGVGTLRSLGLAKFDSALRAAAPPLASRAGAGESKAYGSGYFGEWVSDEFGLPAYRYNCNQVSDPKALSPVHKQWRSPTDHTHQVGNDRLVAAVSNYGYVQVRQDEGSPKFLNDYCPEVGHYGAGIGFLSDGNSLLTTYYPGHGNSFDRIMGEGYLRKIVKGQQYEIDQVILAPFGDDPVLLSTVTITNHGSQVADLRWIEYWGAVNYQFSYRSFMQATVMQATAQSGVNAADLRRQFSGRFAHQFQAMPKGAGLVETQKFLGRSREDNQAWEAVEAYLKKNPSSFLGGPFNLAPGAVMEDLNPPPTFLASLDAPADSFATDASTFFGSGGVDRPSGLSSKLNTILNNDLGSTGPASALLLERQLALRPEESRTLCFLYGYTPQGFEINDLVAKYKTDPAQAWSRSSAAWKTDGVRFSVPSEPWVARETAWHNYYLRSSLTYDDFFREPIISQGHVYQYVMGFQGAARDPLQHALPFVFSNPEVVRGVLRYTLKEIQADGSIPYGIVGSGVPMPVVYHPSDLEMWLLWLASEYVLATRDKNFLDEKIPGYPRHEAGSADPTVRELLRRSFAHLVEGIGVGKHGLMRLSNGDWNDDVVVGHVPQALADEVRKEGESVLNAAMACYVLDYYSRLLTYDGDKKAADEARAKAEGQRQAVRAYWAGRWFRRAWLGSHLGWIGEDQVWLEPQPWAIIGGAATLDQRKTLVAALDELVRKPSPIGAMLLSQGDSAMASPAGVLTNGGVWPSINGTLIWALALADGALAWNEWKKNSLAMHADAYPEIWYGIWSGPDYYNSVLSRYPGQTEFAENPSTDHKVQADLGFNWTDFPVMNMHPHAWPLYSAAKLLGLEFHESGVNFKPDLPLSEYEFTSALLAFKKSKEGYSGWYAPATAGRWDIELRLSSAEAGRMRQVRINGSTTPLHRPTQVIRFTGESGPGKPMYWEIT